MNKTTASKALVLILVAICSLSVAQIAAEDSFHAEVEAEVRAALAAYSALVDAGDWQGGLEFYSDDDRFYWVEVGRMTYESKQQVAEALEGAYTMIEEIEFTTGEPRVTVLTPTLAHVSVASETRMVFEGGHEIQIPSVLSAVLQKGDSGWQFLVGQSAAQSSPGSGRETDGGG